MANIEVNVDAKLSAPAQVRERSIFAIGWVHFKSSQTNQTGNVEDEMRVLGMMVVQDTGKTRSTKEDCAF